MYEHEVLVSFSWECYKNRKKIIHGRASANSHDYYAGTEDLILSLATDDGAAGRTKVVVMVVLLLMELLQRYTLPRFL